MNAQPSQIDPEDVLQRMAREVGTLTAEKAIAESQRDAALRQVATLTQQVADGQVHANALIESGDALRRERDELMREVEKLRPERDGHDPDRDGGGESACAVVDPKDMTTENGFGHP